MISGMKNMSEKDKHIHYESNLKTEVLRRLKSSYINCNNKGQFYSEAFKWIGKYDMETIVINFVLDKEFWQLLDNIIIPEKHGEYDFKICFISELYDALYNNQTTSSHTIDLFLLVKCKEVFGLSSDDINQDNNNRNLLLHCFCEIVEKSLTGNDNTNIYESYYLFIVLWLNIEQLRNNQAKNAIYLYNYINKIIIANCLCSLFRKNTIMFINTIEEIKKSLFIQKNNLFFPFSLEIDTLGQKQGLVNQNKMYQENFNMLSKLNKIPDLSLNNLINLKMETNSDEIINNEVSFELKKRIRNLSVNDYEKLLEIIRSEGIDQDLKVFIISSLYRFELI